MRLRSRAPPHLPPQGLNFVAAILLLHGDEPTAFALLASLVVKLCPVFHVPSMAGLHAAQADLAELLRSKLTEREASVLRMRYGFDDGRARTLEEIGRGLQVTRERVRQIETKALQKLRSPGCAQKLSDYLEDQV